MSTEGHFCWEDCDEGPHGCVCGNDCAPPSEPQGEPSHAVLRNHGGLDMGLQAKPGPSDAAVSVALAAWNATGGSDRDAMRAALDAAATVAHGEPSSIPFYDQKVRELDEVRRAKGRTVPDTTNNESEGKA